MSSLGRVQTAKLAREANASQESLASHPLLSPPPSSAASTPTLQTSSTETSANGRPTSPKYVPYTPRHRVSTSQVTAQSSPPSLGVGGGVTPQLQLQNLKAAAQNAQLTSGSIGWAICEKLFQEGEAPEWEDIWTAVITNKATMLLPLDQAGPQETITPDYVRDHVVYCAPPSNKVVSVVTLSGLRGTLSDNTLTLRSQLSTTSPQFQALVTPTSRVSALAALPPLPSPLIVPLKPEYPIFNVPAPQTDLPFPSQPQHKPQTRPSLPTPRLNPFASLFGARASPATTPAPLPATVVNAINSDEHENKGHSTDVSVYIIQGRIVKKDVLKEITTSVKAELREALTGLPPWLVDKALAFTAPLLPAIPSDVKKPLARQASSSLMEPDMTDQNTASDSFQNFYFSLEEELRVKEQAMDVAEKKFEDSLAAEDRRFQTIERVERTICALFYDQLFRQKSSDDASHDEALASRVAALNMLDLGLEHLGIDVGKAAKGVQAIITEVGKVLQRLQDPSCRSPVDKAATIVAAHNTAVEGLSRLPPIRLKPEEELENEPTPMAAQFKQNRSPRSPVKTFDQSEGTLPPLREESTDASPAEPELLQVPSPTLPQAPSSPTPVASDVLLPFMIYSVVKSNPPELVSHLLYIQRYRMRAGAGGEEGFCLINLLAVVEFLENVDLGALGLADSARVLSVANLAPLPLSPAPFGDDSASSPVSAAARLRGRVNQVEELAGSAGKVVFGVVDSSFSALRGLLSVPGAPVADQSPVAATSPQLLDQAPWNYQREGFGLLRRGTEFTLASVTSSLPALHRVTTGGSRRTGQGEESGQMLIEVPSRPGSVKAGYDHDDSEESEEEGSEEEDRRSDGHSDEEDQDPAKGADINAARSDVRSIRSFQSMMSAESRDRRPQIGGAGRMSLSDRLASVSVRNRLKDTNSLQAQSPPSKRTSLLGVYNTAGAPANSSRPSSPSMSLRISGPSEKFLECQAGDLRISEVAELLQEYRRVVDGMRALNGFEE